MSIQVMTDEHIAAMLDGSFVYSRQGFGSFSEILAWTLKMGDALLRENHRAWEMRYPAETAEWLPFHYQKTPFGSHVLGGYPGDLLRLIEAYEVNSSSSPTYQGSEAQKWVLTTKQDVYEQEQEPLSVSRADIWTFQEAFNWRYGMPDWTEAKSIA